MKITLGPLVCFLVYTFLFVVSFVLILSGPFSDYICKENLYIQSYQKVDKINFPLKWPDLIICKSPLNKNEQKYHDFMNMKYENKEEFENLTNEVFFTKPEEIVYAISIGPTYSIALSRAKLIKIESPYVESMLVDLVYNGYCAKIHLQALKTYMVNQGDISENEIHAKFYALIWIQVILYISY